MFLRLRAYYYQLNPRFRTYLPIVPLCVVISMGWSLYELSKYPQSYSSTARLVVSGRISLPEANAYTEELANFLGTQVEILSGGNLASRARQQVLQSHPGLAGTVSLRVSTLRGTSIIVINASGSNSEYTSRYLDALLDQYVESRRDRRIEATVSAMKQVREEIPRVEQQLAAEEDALFRFKEKHNMGYWNRQSADAGQLLSQLKIREANLRLQLNMVDQMRQTAVTDDREGRLTALNAVTGAAKPPGPVSEVKLSAQVAQLRQQLISLQVEREQKLLIFKSKHPRVVRLDQEIQKLARMIELLSAENESSFEQTVAAMRSEISSISQSILDWERKALESTRAEAEYEKLQNGLVRTRELYARLVNSLQTMDSGQRMNVDIVQTLERASPGVLVEPATSSAVRKGVVIGLFSGIGLVFLLGKLDFRAFATREIEEVVQISDAFEVPLVSDEPKVPAADTKFGISRSMLESVRKISAGLGLVKGSISGSCIVFCVSSTPGEGKSTIALNLAVNAANSGLKTLLIDGDLRRGALGVRVGLPADAKGLAEAVESPAQSWGDHVYPIEHSALSVLPRGNLNSNTIDLLGKWLRPDVLSMIRSRFDLIVIDSAPLAPVADSILFLGLADVVLLITRLKFTRLAQAAVSANLIRSQKTNGYRLVVNGTDGQAEVYGHANGYGYY